MVDEYDVLGHHHYYFPGIIISSNVSAFFAGSDFTVAFIDCFPPNLPNQKITQPFSISSSSSSSLLPQKDTPTTSDDNSSLKEENARLRNENKILREKIKRLESNDKPKKSGKNNQNSIIILDSEYFTELRQVELIGKGGQSKVFKVAHDQYFALKELEIPKRNEDFVSCMRRLLHEYEMINLLDHPNIIKPIGFFFGDEIHPPSILLEYCPYDLSRVVKNLSDVERVTSIYEICCAMKKVHESRMIHRDLKPENILLDENKHVKISDFGISYFDDSDSMHSKTAGVGTLRYMAPELLNESTHYDEKVDVYSFGIVMFFILTKGQLPSITIADVVLGKIAPIPDYINEFSRELIISCWSFVPQKRPSFSEILEIIQSNDFKFINGIERDLQVIRNFLSLE